MKEEDKGCIAAVFTVVLFVLIGNLLFKVAEPAGFYLARILLIIGIVALIVFLFMVYKGTKK